MAGDRDAELGALGEELVRQANECGVMRALLDGMEWRLDTYLLWLSGDDAPWERIRAACGPASFAALAARLGMDAAASTAEDVFLAGLSTVPTYREAWALVLRFSVDADREALLDIWRMEEAVNGLARRIFRLARHLYRGESVSEAVGTYYGTVGPAMNYSFVSASSDPLVAAGFAVSSHGESKETAVVLAIDARKARGLGISAATYSLASDALGLRRDGEGTDRTFPMIHARELQAHFCAGWPPGSRAAMVAILTVLPPTPGELRRMEGTGLPLIPLWNLYPKRA